MPGTFDFSKLNLAASPDILQDHYLTAVEALMAADDGLASTPEGLSTLVNITKYYVNSGKPRKGWLTIRRALNFAQMLGFHRQTFDLNDPISANKKALWLTIFQIERFLSLLLGYPSACLDNQFQNVLAAKGDEVAKTADRFFLKLGTVTGQIINRNQDPKSMTISVTLQIDQDLEDARAMVPPEWHTLNPEDHSPGTDTFDRFIAKTFFNNIRMLLHLPFMLKSSTDRRYEYSRIAALESSRLMIECYHALRSAGRPLISVCNVMDYQVFTAGMLLTVDLLGNPDASSGIASESRQATADWNLITCLINDLEDVIQCAASRGTTGVAQQAVTILRDLSKARYGSECQGSACEGFYQAVVPYFGKIKVRWGKQSPGH